MREARSAEEVRHPVLEGLGGRSFSGADLTDRQRIGVLLQGAALLSHLRQAGWRLTKRWSGAKVSDSGLLRSVSAEPGGWRELPQAVLHRLATELFGGQVAGRGEGRRIVRQLLDAWAQTLTPLSEDEAVDQILDAAPFLWQQSFGAARRALLGVHLRSGRAEPWIAGPGACRLRLLSAAGGEDDLEALIVGDGCRDLWRGASSQTDPREHASAGRWRLAIAAWEKAPPRSSGDTLDYARCLFSVGRFARALTLLRPLPSRGALVLRMACQYQLGELRAAKSTLHRLEKDGLSPEETVTIAPTAVRVLANLGDGSAIRDWIARVIVAGQDKLKSRARLTAAEACWDLGDVDAMTGYLETTQGAAADADLAWIYHRVRALEATARGDGRQAAFSLGEALRSSRRLRCFERGRLWNELGVARVLLDDLPAAERACRHAVRLLNRCEGAVNKTLALPNLAEVRIRRGRLDGVESILKRASEANELAGNRRGSAEDAELWARYALARGDAEGALVFCRRVRERLREAGVAWKRPELQVFCARALGWLGRESAAAAELSGLDASAAGHLEPEERPALWALAGNQELAADEASKCEQARLWLGVLGEEALMPALWEELEGLEAYRAARLVFDLERTRSGCVPARWLATAIDTLRRVGARGLADRLEADRRGPWQALQEYLTESTGDPRALREFFVSAGYAEIALTWVTSDGEIGEILIDGAGGGEEVSAPLASGRLVLSAPRIDEVLRAAFSLVLRDVPLPAPASLGGSATGSGLVGQSADLRMAVERLAKLARQHLSILILGETGTGKELAAREVHRLSQRSERPFQTLNCAALAENLLLSELFGHAKGAYTGADTDRVGVFEASRGGTVFLDEIGDLPPTAQGALLRVLQEGEVRRLGENQPRQVDFRIVTATNRDLDGLVRAGRFRADLFYRLNAGTVRLPPLRDRVSDILLLAEHFLAPLRGSDGRRRRLSREAERRLMTYTWPGNVRELKNTVERGVALCDSSETIREEHLGLPPTSDDAEGSFNQQMAALRRKLVVGAIGECGGNQAAAARRLGLTRQALSYHIRQLAILGDPSDSAD